MRMSVHEFIYNEIRKMKLEQGDIICTSQIYSHIIQMDSGFFDISISVKETLEIMSLRLKYIKQVLGGGDMYEIKVSTSEWSI